MISRKHRPWLYPTFLVLAGVALVAGGGLLVLDQSAPPVPDWADAQIGTPMINIYAEGVFTPLAVHADFTSDNEYRIQLFPTTSDADEYNPSPLPVNVTQRVNIVVTAFKEFTWSADPGLDHVELTATGDGIFESRLTNRLDGTGTKETFFGVLQSQGTPMILRLTPSEPSIQRSGPYIRVILPQVASEPRGYIEDAGPISDAQEYESRLASALRTGKVDGIDYSPAKLFIRAVATPFEAFNVEWLLHRATPGPIGGQPLVWVETQRFIVDLVYRDLAWERAAGQKVLIGGVLLGLGTATVLIPFGLRRTS